MENITNLFDFVFQNSGKIVKYLAGLFSPSILFIFVFNQAIFETYDILKLLILALAISSSTYFICYIFEFIDLLIALKKNGVYTNFTLFQSIAGKLEIELPDSKVALDQTVAILEDVKDNIGETALIYNFFILSLATLLKLFMPALNKKQIVLIIIIELIIILFHKYHLYKKMRFGPPPISES